MALVNVVFPRTVTLDIPALKEVAVALGRIADALESQDGGGDGEDQQPEVDQLTNTLQQANQRTKQATDRIREAIANNEEE